MGSVFKTSELPDYTNQNILKVFKELEKYTILWKYDGKIDNLPKNVYIRSWMPQTSILGDVVFFLTYTYFIILIVAFMTLILDIKVDLYLFLGLS